MFHGRENVARRSSLFSMMMQPKKDDDSSSTDGKSESKPYRTEGSDGKLYDRDGVEVRECPECGHNMYQQGRTWTCENCGYSYVE